MYCIRFGLAVVLCTSAVFILAIGLSSQAVAPVRWPSRVSSLQIEPFVRVENVGAARDVGSAIPTFRVSG